MSVPEQSFALNHLDYKLRSLCDFRHGFFVEAGANDGCSQSNTLYFEQYLDWNGLLVEPVPALARACAANRPASTVECVALVSDSFSGISVPMRYCNLMTVVRGAMKTAEEEEAHLAKGCRLQEVEVYEFDAPAQTLTSLLERHRVERVDLLSLDVEGYELEALRGLDFRRHQPRLMLIEARYRAEIEAYLKPLYEPVLALSHHDVLYRLR